MTRTIKELVQGNFVHFQEYRKGNLWYCLEDDPSFVFPVPIDDIGDGVFKKVDRAILFMRYIRKHLENLADGQAVQQD